MSAGSFKRWCASSLRFLIARMDRNASAMSVTAPREVTTPMIASLRVFDEDEPLELAALLLLEPVPPLLPLSPLGIVTELTANEGSTCSARVLYGEMSAV